MDTVSTHGHAARKGNPQLDLPSLHSWQFFNACRRLLGDSFLQKLFQRSNRQIFRWAADPDFAADTERNPMDRYEVLLSRLMEIGREDVARAAVTRQALLIGCELRCLEDVQPDKADVRDEILDDHPAILAFHEAIRLSQDPVWVHELYQRAKREIEETYSFYAGAHGKG
jgi:hypothetical protein